MDELPNTGTSSSSGMGGGTAPYLALLGLLLVISGALVFGHRYRTER